MKKLAALMLVSALAVTSLTGCGAKAEAPAETAAETTAATEAAEAPATEEAAAPESADGTYEIALVTDVGNIDDKSFNQGSWEGVQEYAEANGKTYNYYRPSEDSAEARIETIKAAIDKGAKVVVCPGYLHEDTVFAVQNEYPDVQFLLLDGEPHSADYATYETAKNTHCILYKEEQAGYLAGYAAVKEGFTELGFLGGMEVPAVIRYGYGFIQGAEAAAVEDNVDVNMKYWYSGSFNPTDDIKTKMSGWYTEGTQTVFACGGGIYLSAVAAADGTTDGKLIGVDVDQSGDSDRVVTSAMKELTTSVVLALTDLYENGGTWPEELAGVTSTLGAAEDCVGLPTAEGSWRLENFTVEQYEELYKAVKDGSVEISNATDAAPATTKVKVDFQN